MENNKSTAGIITAVIAVMVIGGGALWFINRDSSDTSNQESQTSTQTQEAESQPEQETVQADIVVLATQTESLSTLVTAVKAAELVDTLQGDGPFTVFAPTNDAFEALPAGTLDSLLKPENKDQLTAVLTYHVVPGKVLADDLKDGQEITTVQGGKLTVKLMDGKAYLIDTKGNQVMVEKADVNAENGVVHVIGGVLLPS